MTHSHPASRGDRILEPRIALARCSKRQRIVVAGSKSIGLTSELSRRGFIHVASTANCGRAAGQYDVALVDWRRRTFQALETTLDWLVDVLKPGGLLVVWIDRQKQAMRQDRWVGLERRGFLIEDVMSLAPRFRRGDARKNQSLKPREASLMRNAGARMKDVVVIGAGQIGTTVAGLLAATNHYQVTLVGHSFHAPRVPLEAVDDQQSAPATPQD
jgi:hypothetical protein